MKIVCCKYVVQNELPRDAHWAATYGYSWSLDDDSERFLLPDLLFSAVGSEFSEISKSDRETTQRGCLTSKHLLIVVSHNAIQTTFN